MQGDLIELDLSKFTVMKRVILIDGNNLIHKIPDLRRLYSENPEAAVLTLLERVKRNISSDGKPILVMDGDGNIKNNCIVYSGRFTADDVIRKYIEEEYQKKSIAVITSDNEIISIAKACGCDIIKSEEFSLTGVVKNNPTKKSNKKEDTNEKPSGMSKKDFDFFKKHFS